ncbi:MAG: hypothetical protein AAFX50_19515, partial [Acidobacteriota bacterium]
MSICRPKSPAAALRRRVATVALLATLPGLLVAQALAPETDAGGPNPDPRPNLILLMVDDLSSFEMQYSFGRALGDGTNAYDTYFTEQGATFPQFFNTTVSGTWGVG